MIEPIFFCLSQIPFVATLVFALPTVSIGNWNCWLCNIHRIFGILTLTCPFLLSLYVSAYLVEPHIVFYLFCIFVTLFNCISGVLLFPKKLNKFDISTIREFCVGAVLGISFVGLSSNYKFGHLEWYEPFGYLFSIHSTIAIFYCINDSIQHVYRMITGPSQFRKINFDYLKPPKSPSESFNYNMNKYKKNKKMKGVYEKVTIYDAFVTSTFKYLKPDDKIMLIVHQHRPVYLLYLLLY